LFYQAVLPPEQTLNSLKPDNLGPVEYMVRRTWVQLFRVSELSKTNKGKKEETT